MNATTHPTIGPIEPIDLEALRAALAKVVVHPLHHFGDVITDAYVCRKYDWEVITEALAELTARRARDAETHNAMAMALQHIRLCAPDPTVDAALDAVIAKYSGSEGHQ